MEGSVHRECELRRLPGACLSRIAHLGGQDKVDHTEATLNSAPSSIVYQDGSDPRLGNSQCDMLTGEAPGIIPVTRSEPVVRELLRPALERQDLGVPDRAIPDVDSPADRLVRVPCRGPGDHCPEVRH